MKKSKIRSEEIIIARQRPRNPEATASPVFFLEKSASHSRRAYGDSDSAARDGARARNRKSSVRGSLAEEIAVVATH